MLDVNGTFLVGNWSVESSPKMEGIMNVWAMVEHVRVASGAVELAIFTVILYWFFTSSRVADMLELVGERVGGWCGRDSSGPTLRQAVRRRRQPDLHARVDSERVTRASALYRVKETTTVPAPQPPQRPAAGLACPRCAPLSRDSWQDKRGGDNGAVINILDIGRQNFANGGVVSRYLCDVAQCCHLTTYDYKDVVPEVEKDSLVQRAIDETTEKELKSATNGAGDLDARSLRSEVRRKVEARAKKIIADISSAMSNHVLRLVAWLCHKAIRRVAGGGCGTSAACVARLARARAAGLPLVFVPLHRSHFDYILVTFTLYLTGLRPPLVAAGDNMRIPFFGWFLRGCGAFYIKRRAHGGDQTDDIYKAALRAYILNSLAAKNNIEFFIEGGRTRTGKPQPPKAGILSVITDAYLDGTIDDALLVPVTVNYDKLVDGNFVREQLGRPKQMETFWSALRGIWHTLNTNHGGIRVDFNQPISLKEMITSFKKYNFLQAPIEPTLSLNNNNLAATIDRHILYNHSHSSLYGASVSNEHKMMLEAIGRHLVYDAAQSTALMSTNIVSYVLLTSCRGGVDYTTLCSSVEVRSLALAAAGRDVPGGATSTMVKHALDMLGKSLIDRSGSGNTGRVRPLLTVPAALELAYYANAVVAHYAIDAIVATALEQLVVSGASTIRESTLCDTSLKLVAVLAHEFLLCPPCRTSEDLVLDAIARLQPHIIVDTRSNCGLEEQLWSRRIAETLEEDEDMQERDIRYKLVESEEATVERRRLLLTIRPLLAAYSATCRRLEATPATTVKEVVADTIDALTQAHARMEMPYGEAVSSDAIQNCLKLLKQWSVLNIYSEGKDRKISLCPPYDEPQNLTEICQIVHGFNMATPLLSDVK